jgi:hypothetical protein
MQIEAAIDQCQKTAWRHKKIWTPSPPSS